MAFLFDTRRVKPCGLAAELVMPQNDLELGPAGMSQQFARTPYAVSFYASGQTFILVTLHVKYGEREEERAPELKAIAQWMAEWAYDIEPTSSGCRVTESWTDRRPGFFKPIAAKATGVSDRIDHNRSTMEQTLERLASAAEAVGGAG